ncbi:hypothetical protein Pyn_27074 [Prunus yedoensis var. nudiflora]|uniref:Uncharacterized protein n=1 Tax=Prunus yedoensis var. nudiflora TaxID=2094558 RepID=A0A314XMC5_PRUYE|nr:hypothetical protein Pyn_27074 [Prunus yedoensis var. nudiflora]
MEWWSRKMKYPVRKFCSRVTTRLGIRKSGLPKLQHDIRSCEYDDVHVMWRMLNQSEKTETIQLGGSSKKKRFSNLSNWFKRTPFVCRAF